MFGTLPSVEDIDRLKNLWVDKDVCGTAYFGKSKAGKLQQVCKNAKFFTDGYFDFEDKLWKSGGEIIDDSRWFTTNSGKNDPKGRKYPVLLDRFAYVKRRHQNRV